MKTPDGRLSYGGSRDAVAADGTRNRDEYVNLQSRLAMSRAALAKLLALSIGTVGLYPARSNPTRCLPMPPLP